MNINREKTVAIIGYNLAKIFETSLELNILNILVDKATKVVDTLCENGYTTFMCGINDGFEMIAAEAVIQAKTNHPQIRLVAVLPFSGHENKYSSPDKLRYKQIMDCVDETLILSDRETLKTRSLNSAISY